MGAAKEHAGHVDVLVLTAVQDELDAVLAVGEQGRAGWEDDVDAHGFRFFRRTIFSAKGRPIRLAACWIGGMGTVPTAIRGAQLIPELRPSLVAMCGICAGCRGKVAQGDVIVADQIYRYDEGMSVTEPGKPSRFYHALRTFELPPTWRMDAAFLAREIDLERLSRDRPRTKEAQCRWLLHSIEAYEAGNGLSPSAPEHPERKTACPSYPSLVKECIEQGFVIREGRDLRLTEKGRDRVNEDLTVYPDGPPSEPKFGVHVGAIATGTAVVEDSEIFGRLRGVVRTTTGLEMEGAALGELAQRYETRFFLVKAVQDFADHEKDDGFRKFACRASAEFLFAFLEKHFEPEPEREEREREKRAELPQLGLEREDPFFGRVERVMSLRHPGGRITRHSTVPPFAGLLEVEIDAEEMFDVRLVGALDRPITEELLGSFVRDVESPFRERYPHLRSTLVHQGSPAPRALREEAFRLGVALTTFRAYQGIFDLTKYLEWQTARLERSEVYPPSIYVDPPARYEIAGSREQQNVDDALRFLWDLLASPEQRRFALVLGDGGAGKTFLLRELSRRMVVENHPVWPVLVEMASLEKTHDLPALLAAHFAQADVPGYNFKAFRYMLEAGRIALLFDGFDELADRVTYETVHAHFDTVLSAAQGGLAKVVLSSRRQHFLSETQVKLELTRRAETIPGFHMMLLQPFEEPQIRRYLRNVLGDERAADERYALIDEVKDLLGLSHNPRMLGFIARIPEQALREAKTQQGTITAAGLYELLVKDWLDFEHRRSLRLSTRKGISREALDKGMAVLAMSMWHAKQKTVEVEQIRDVLTQALAAMKAPTLDPDVIAHLFGSGSLLVRDAESRFSFVHRSVLEWFVAREAAAELKGGGDTAALGVDEMSALMADFFHSMVGRDKALEWARGKVFGLEKGIATTNAVLVLQRLKESFELVNFAGQDLRGRDFTGVDWREADLRGADLTGATLEGADLSGANLTGAKLSRANLSRARLVGARFGAAELRFARLSGAKLAGSAGLESADLWAANLVGVSGVSESIIQVAETLGGAPPALRRVEPGWIARASECLGIAFDRRGELLAAGYADGTVRVFNAWTGEVLRIFAGHTNMVWSIAWSPDGKAFASASEDHTVRLWDVASARSYRVLEGHSHWVRSVAWSPDGNALASGSYDNTVRLWDMTSGRISCVLEGHVHAVTSIAWSPDGSVVASGSCDNTVRLWEVASGRTSRVLEGHTNWVYSIAWNPHGRSLASGSYDKTVRIWDVASGSSSHVLEGHTNKVRSVAWSPDGKVLASCSEDKTVRLWDTASSRLSRLIEGHTARVWCVVWSPDGKAVASASDDDTIRLWDAVSGRALHVFEGYEGSTTSIVWGPNGKTITASSADNSIRLWDVESCRSFHTFVGHTNWVRSVALSPDGQTLASGSDDKTVRLWNIASGRCSGALEGHASWVHCVAWSPDGKLVASGGKDKTVRVWEAASGTPYNIFKGHQEAVSSLAWSRDGKTLASGSGDNTLRIWDLISLRVLGVLRGHKNWVSSIALSPEGKELASGSRDNTVRVWDVASRQSTRVLEGHAYWVTSVAWSPDGKVLASGSDDNTVRLWDIASGRFSHILKGHTNSVLSVTWSPDGKILASGSSDNTIRLWDVATGQCLAILLATASGWVAFSPDGRYKFAGNIRGSFWHVVGLCRFEPGELDEFVPNLRMADDEPFLR